MTASMTIRAYSLAEEIEVIHAKRECKAARRREGPSQSWEQFYDPMAAHLLGDLILSRLFPTPTTTQGEVD